MEILECGHPESPHSAITRGYGRDKDGNRFCYDCCHKMDLESMKNDSVFGAYVNSDKTEITNWPGYRLARITASWWRKNNFALKLLHVRAVDQFGQEWYGDGPGEGMYIKLRKVKKHLTRQ